MSEYVTKQEFVTFKRWVVVLLIGGCVGISAWFTSALRRQENATPSGRIVVKNDKGEPALMLGSTVDGNGALELYNSAGDKVVSLGVLENGSGGIIVYSNDGNVGLRLVTNPMGLGTVEVLGPRGELIAILGTDSSGRPMLKH